MNDNRFTKRHLLSYALLLAGAVWIFASRLAPADAMAARIHAVRQGFMAPDFSLQTPSGEQITLSELRGQAVLVNLWASWCAPCRLEMPAFQRVYAEYGNQGLVILAVNATHQDDPGQALALVQELGLTFPVVLDTGGSVAQAYHLSALPSSFFIDKEGIIREITVGGPMSEALLRIRIDQLLKGEG